jgi:hypothetical protein
MGKLRLAKAVYLYQTASLFNMAVSNNTLLLNFFIIQQQQF